MWVHLYYRKQGTEPPEDATLDHFHHSDTILQITFKLQRANQS